MVKPAGVTDPLLRRPFSVFEVLRNADGEVTGVSILNKRAGRSTNKLYELEPGDVVSCLGPLGVPFKPVAAPIEAWMVAGGVGLAPFRDAGGIAGRVEDAGHAVLRRAHRRRTVLSRLLRTARHQAGADHRGRRHSVNRHCVKGRVTASARSGAEEPVGRSAGAMVYACGPEPMLEAVAKLAARYNQPCAGVGGARDGLRPRRLLQLRRAGEARRRAREPGAFVHQRPGVRRRRAGVGLMAPDLSVTLGIADAAQSADRGQRLLRLRPRVRAGRRSVDRSAASSRRASS